MAAPRLVLRPGESRLDQIQLNGNLKLFIIIEIEAFCYYRIVNPLQRFNVGFKLTSYPCFGLVDLSNLQSSHLILRMDEEGSCTPKSLYPNTPSIMALKESIFEE